LRRRSEDHLHVSAIAGPIGFAAPAQQRAVHAQGADHAEEMAFVGGDLAAEDDNSRPLFGEEA
jgi:hypothetical protein